MGLVELGQFIERERGRLGLTQVQFGQRIGRNQDWISKVERGVAKDEPRADTLHRLAELTGTPIEEILEITGHLRGVREPVIFTRPEDIREGLKHMRNLPEPARRAIEAGVDMIEEMERRARNGNG